MTIHLYLENQEETEITSFYDLNSNPFKIGDELALDVEDIEAKHFLPNIILGMEERQKLFHRKKVKIVRENKYIRINAIKESIITIDYHCTYAED